jgi:hypothetical protein
MQFKHAGYPHESAADMIFALSPKLQHNSKVISYTFLVYTSTPDLAFGYLDAITVLQFLDMISCHNETK